jgi:ectoine hydroxylase
MNVREDLYPSRDGRSSSVQPRRDPVIHDAGAAGPLDAPQLLRYRQDGYLPCDGLFSHDEIASYQGAVSGLCVAEHVLARPETIREPNGNAVRSIFNPHGFSTPLAQLVRDPRLVGIARQILGTDVYIHQCRVNFKPAFTGKEFYWHSDFETWHVEDGLPRMRALSISINLSENNEFNGPLMVIPGSHRHFIACAGTTPENHHAHSLRRQQYGTPDPEHITALVRDYGIVAPKGSAGSLVVFDSNMMHGSGANISPSPRCNLFVVYNSTDNAPEAPFCGLAPRPSYIANRDVEPLGLAP